MRMIAIHAQTERKRLDRSVRCAEKRRPWARKQRLRGLIRPDPAVCATAGAACGRKSLSSARIQAIFTSNDTPLGECRLSVAVAHRSAATVFENLNGLSLCRRQRDGRQAPAHELGHDAESRSRDFRLNCELQDKKPPCLSIRGDHLEAPLSHNRCAFFRHGFKTFDNDGTAFCNDLLDLI